MVELSLVFFIYMAVMLSGVAIITDRLRISDLLYTFLYSFFLYVIAATNFELNIFEQKFAAQFSFDIYAGNESATGNSGFILQYLLNLPAFIITNAWWVSISTNIVLMSWVFWYVRNKNKQYLYILFAPAIINFSMFSLRDPIISVLFFIITLAIADVSSRGRSFKILGVSSLFLFIRPESIVMVVLERAWSIIEKNKKSAYLIIIVPVSMVGLYFILLQIPGLLGIKSWNGSLFDLPDVINNFYESRTNRWESGEEGGESNILGGRLIEMPFYIRYPIQVLTFFMLPLPFEIKKFSLALAFLDSIFFIFITIKFHREANKKTKVFFWIYVLMMSFFANNYGNMFRLRLPAYFIILGGLMRK